MQIGELARRTATPARRLRYYEEQGLLSSQRADFKPRSDDAPPPNRAIHPDADYRARYHSPGL